MTHPDQPSLPSTTDGDAAKRRREQRLAEALRENLKRRKAQVRGRVEAPSDRPPGEPA